LADVASVFDKAHCAFGLGENWISFLFLEIKVPCYRGFGFKSLLVFFSTRRPRMVPV
jgi:hypothetical protein